eukprot:185898_1
MITLINDNVIIYAHYIKEILHLLKLKLKGNTIRSTKSFKVHFIPLSLIRKHSLSINTPVPNIKKIDDNEIENILMSNEETRRSNQHSISDVIRHFVNNGFYKDNNNDINGAEQVMIIKRNGIDRCTDIIYKCDKNQTAEISSILQINSTSPSSVIAITFKIYGNEITMSYSYGECKYELQLDENALLTTLMPLFNQPKNTDYNSFLFGNIQKIIMDINATKDEELDISDLINCFVMNDINQHYFQMEPNGRKLEFIQLLKTNCNVKARYATVLWDNLYTIYKNTKLSTLKPYTCNKKHKELYDTFYTDMLQTQYELTNLLKKKNEEITKLKQVIALYIEPYVQEEEKDFESDNLSEYESTSVSEIVWNPSVPITSISNFSTCITDNESESSVISFNTDVSECNQCIHLKRLTSAYNEYNNTIDISIYGKNVKNIGDDYMHIIMKHPSHQFTNIIINAQNIINPDHNIIRQMLTTLRYISIPSTGDVVTCPAAYDSNKSNSNNNSYNDRNSDKQNGNYNNDNSEHLDDSGFGGSGGDGNGKRDKNNDDDDEKKRDNYKYSGNNSDDDDEKDEEKDDQKG